LHGQSHSLGSQPGWHVFQEENKTVVCSFSQVS
jgi:hypothetical protein